MSGYDEASGAYSVYGMKINAEFTPENGTAGQSTVWANTGFEVKAIERYGAFARVNAVTWNEGQNVWEGISDADWEGSAAGPNSSKCDPD